LTEQGGMAVAETGINIGYGGKRTARFIAKAAKVVQLRGGERIYSKNSVYGVNPARQRNAGEYLFWEKLLHWGTCTKILEK